MKNAFFSVLAMVLAVIVWALVPAATVSGWAQAKAFAVEQVAELRFQAFALWQHLKMAAVVRMAPYAQAFQTTIGTTLALGVIGEFFLDAGGSSRVQPGVLKGTAANLVVGRWFTIDPADGTFVPGGAGGVPGGILMSPKEYSTPGTAAGGALAPTLTLLAGTVGSFCTDTPGIIVALPGAAAVGAALKYNDTTGVILAGAPGAGETAIANARVVRYANLAAGLAVVSLIGN